MGSGTTSAAAVCVSDRYDDGAYSGGSHAALSAELNSCGRNAATFTVS
jgi:hypothetical protein